MSFEWEMVDGIDEIRCGGLHSSCVVNQKSLERKVSFRQFFSLSKMSSSLILFPPLSLQPAADLSFRSTAKVSVNLPEFPSHSLLC